MRHFLLIAGLAACLAHAERNATDRDDNLQECEELYEGNYDEHEYRASPRTECINTEDDDGPKVTELQEYLGDK